jgi:hypothetical protein
MGADYIPESDNGAASWMSNFAAKLKRFPSKYAVDPQEAAMIDRVVQDYLAALSRAKAESTRNKGTVSAKNTALANAKRVCRLYAALIKPNLGIDDRARLEAGLPVPSVRRRKIDVPLASPYIGVMAATNGAHTITFGDSLDINRRAKPFGALSLQLFLHIGDERTRSPAEASFYRAFTTKPAVVHFEPKDSGKWATYFGRWASRRGDTGNWSAPTSFRIAA